MEMEEKRHPLKVVGRKGTPKADIVSMDGIQRVVNALRVGRPFAPRGRLEI